MKSLKEIVEKILDLTSSVDPTDNTRWGHDTSIGDNDRIIQEVCDMISSYENEKVAELREQIERRIKDLSTGDSVDVIARIELEEILKDDLFNCENPREVCPSCETKGKVFVAHINCPKCQGKGFKEGIR